MNTAKIIKTIKEHELDLFFNLTPTTFIELNDFTLADIEQIMVKSDGSIGFVRFYDINGIIPLKYFDSYARRRIVKQKKIRNTALWRTLND